MLWLILCLASALIYSFTGFFDNYISDVIYKGNRAEAVKMYYGPTYIIYGIILACVLGIGNIDLKAIGLIAASSALISVSTIFYYRALKNEDATGAAVYYQLSPLIYLLVDIFILGKQIGALQFAGFFAVLLAPIIIILSRKRASSRRLAISSAIMFLLYVIIASTGGSVFAIVVNDVKYNPISLFIVSQITRGIADCFIAFPNKKWRKRNKNIWRTQAKRILAVTLINQLIFIAAEFCYRYSLALTNSSSVAVVVNAAELIMTFILGIILSIIWPNFGREKIRRHEVLAHLFAVAVAAIGIVLIN